MPPAKRKPQPLLYRHTAESVGPYAISRGRNIQALSIQPTCPPVATGTRSHGCRVPPSARHRYEAASRSLPRRG